MDYAHKLKYKTLSYSTYNDKTGKEENMYRPKHVEKKLNKLAQDGWYILWAFNTQSKIELLLAKEIGKITPKQRLEAEMKKRNKLLLKMGITKHFNADW